VTNLNHYYTSTVWWLSRLGVEGTAPRWSRWPCWGTIKLSGWPDV